jgi:glycogen synthase kinase 3 beta
MAYSGQRRGGVGSSSRPGSGFRGVDFLGREIMEMQLRDAKPDADDERVCLEYCSIGLLLNK